MKALILATIVLGAATAASAQVPGPLTGEKLLDFCSAPDVQVSASTPVDTPLKGAMCYGFLMGADQTTEFYNHNAYCLQPGVDFKQIRLVVLKYLKDHPEILNRSAAESVVSAMSKAFPCHTN